MEAKSTKTQLRLARHTRRLDEVARFYRDGIGLTEVGGFHDHGGYDGIFLAVQGTGTHLELTAGGGQGAPAPHPESLLVLFLADDEAVQTIAARLGVDPITPANPYWGRARADVSGPGRLSGRSRARALGGLPRVTGLSDPPARPRSTRGPMALATDDDLYVRGAATLLASWEEYARGCAGAALRRLHGVSAAVFPSGPERAVYNNALLERDLGPTERVAAVDAMEAAYGSAGIDRYAAWVHESDEAMRAELSGRGYTIAESTRAMGMSLNDIPIAPPDLELGPLDWPEYLDYLRAFGVPAGLLSGADPSAFHLLGARLAGETVATALVFDHEGDCGVFNMSTLEGARRRGLATALTARHLHDAVERGCSTASLQATPMAERVYAAAGFRDLGRFLEYAPQIN